MSICTAQTAKKCSRWQKKRVVVLPVVMLVVFAVCQTLPDLVTILKRSKNATEEDDTEETCTILYGISNIANALIYVYHLEDIRNFLIQKYVSLVFPIAEEDATVVKHGGAVERSKNLLAGNAVSSHCDFVGSNAVPLRCDGVTLQDVVDHVTDRGKNKRLFTIITQV